MALSEYAVPDDFFQYDTPESNGLRFPCCVCRHQIKASIEMPCRFCGHNDGAEDHFRCCLCGEIEPGTPQDENYLAMGTPAEIGPMCITCRNTLAAKEEN